MQSCNTSEMGCCCFLSNHNIECKVLFRIVNIDKHNCCQSSFDQKISTRKAVDNCLSMKKWVSRSVAFGHKSWQRHDFIRDSFQESESCAKFQTRNRCASQRKRCKIESLTCGDKCISPRQNTPTVWSILTMLCHPSNTINSLVINNAGITWDICKPIQSPPELLS